MMAFVPNARDIEGGPFIVVLVVDDEIYGLGYMAHLIWCPIHIINWDSARKAVGAKFV